MSGIHSASAFLKKFNSGDQFWYIDEMPEGSPPIMGPVIVHAFEFKGSTPMIKFFFEGRYTSKSILSLTDKEHGVFLSEQDARDALKARLKDRAREISLGEKRRKLRKVISPHQIDFLSED